MSDAVEAAEVMLYCVSEKYTESANCRLEANYGVQEKCDMVPLMVQENYRARGWLLSTLGSRLWYPFYPRRHRHRSQVSPAVDAPGAGWRGQICRRSTLLLLSSPAAGPTTNSESCCRDDCWQPIGAA